MAFRDGPFENIKVPLAWTAAVVVVVAIIGAVVLLLGDRTTPEGGSSMGAARGGFEAAAGPVGGVFAAPVRWGGAARVYVVTTDTPAEFSYIHDRWPRIIQKTQQTGSIVHD